LIIIIIIIIIIILLGRIAYRIVTLYALYKKLLCMYVCMYVPVALSATTMLYDTIQYGRLTRIHVCCTTMCDVESLSCQFLKLSASLSCEWTLVFVEG